MSAGGVAATSSSSGVSPTGISVVGPTGASGFTRVAGVPV